MRAVTRVKTSPLEDVYFQTLWSRFYLKKLKNMELFIMFLFT